MPRYLSRTVSKLLAVMLGTWYTIPGDLIIRVVLLHCTLLNLIFKSYQELKRFLLMIVANAVPQRIIFVY